MGRQANAGTQRAGSNISTSTSPSASTTANITRRGAFRLAGAALAGLGISALAPVPAHAVPPATQETLNALSDAQSRYDAAQAQLEQIGAELEELGYQQAQTQEKVDGVNSQIADQQKKIDAKQAEIDKTQGQIDSTQAQIKSTQDSITKTEREIDQKQDLLSRRIKSDYKAGPTNILSVALNAATMDEFLSGVHYMDAIQEQDSQQVAEIKDLKAQLEDQKKDLESKKSQLEDAKASLVSQQDELEAAQAELVTQRNSLQSLQAQLNSQAAATQAKSQEATNLVNSLDGEVKDLMAKRDAEIQAAREEEERKAREAAARAARAGSYSAAYGATGTSGTLDAATRQTIVQAALSLLGTPYVWGGTWPTSGGTDCSGLCQWAYRQGGFSIPRTTYTQIPYCRQLGHLFSDTTQLQPGDLVFANGGHHVAMYIGNDQCVHDPHPGDVVNIKPLSYFTIYAMGTPVA